MNTNELMIGDFLRYKQDSPDTHLQGKIVNVCGIRDIRERVDARTIDDGNFHESVNPDWLEPIPITPEILEKNGWTYYEDDKDSFHGEDCVFLKQKTGGYTMCIDKVRTISGIIHYVHELQHALRLCGFEKEIKL